MDLTRSLKELLRSTLHSYLSQFIEEVRLEELGILGGDVVLENLQIRKDVLQKALRVPTNFDIARGSIRELRISIPWTRLLSQPVLQVKIRTIEIVVHPRHFSATTEDDEAESKDSPKGQKTPSGGAPEQGKSGSWWVKKVLMNVFLKIENVILKYEDEDIVASAAMCSLSLHSADPADNWSPAYCDVTSEAPLFYKVLNLNDITLCLDKYTSASPSASSPGLRIVERFEAPLLDRASVSVRLRMDAREVLGLESEEEWEEEGEAGGRENLSSMSMGHDIFPVALEGFFLASSADQREKARVAQLRVLKEGIIELCPLLRFGKKRRRVRVPIKGVGPFEDKEDGWIGNNDQGWEGTETVSPFLIDIVCPRLRFTVSDGQILMLQSLLQSVRRQERGRGASQGSSQAMLEKEESIEAISPKWAVCMTSCFIAETTFTLLHKALKKDKSGLESVTVCVLRISEMIYDRQSASVVDRVEASKSNFMDTKVQVGRVEAFHGSAQQQIISWGDANCNLLHRSADKVMMAEMRPSVKALEEGMEQENIPAAQARVFVIKDDRALFIDISLGPLNSTFTPALLTDLKALVDAATLHKEPVSPEHVLSTPSPGGRKSPQSPMSLTLQVRAAHRLYLGLGLLAIKAKDVVFYMNEAKQMSVEILEMWLGLKGEGDDEAYPLFKSQRLNLVSTSMDGRKILKLQMSEGQLWMLHRGWALCNYVFMNRDYPCTIAWSKNQFLTTQYLIFNATSATIQLEKRDEGGMVGQMLVKDLEGFQVVPMAEVSHPIGSMPSFRVSFMLPVASRKILKFDMEKVTLSFSPSILRSFIGSVKFLIKIVSGLSKSGTRDQAEDDKLETAILATDDGASAASNSGMDFEISAGDLDIKCSAPWIDEEVANMSSRCLGFKLSASGTGSQRLKMEVQGFEASMAVRVGKAKSVAEKPDTAKIIWALVGSFLTNDERKDLSGAISILPPLPAIEKTTQKLICRRMSTNPSSPIFRFVGADVELLQTAHFELYIPAVLSLLKLINCCISSYYEPRPSTRRSKSRSGFSFHLHEPISVCFPDDVYFRSSIRIETHGPLFLRSEGGDVNQPPSLTLDPIAIQLYNTSSSHPLTNPVHISYRLHNVHISPVEIFVSQEDIALLRKIAATSYLVPSRPAPSPSPRALDPTDTAVENETTFVISGASCHISVGPYGCPFLRIQILELEATASQGGGRLTAEHVTLLDGSGLEVVGGRWGGKGKDALIEWRKGPATGSLDVTFQFTSYKLRFNPVILVSAVEFISGCSKNPTGKKSTSTIKRGGGAAIAVRIITERWSVSFTDNIKFEADQVCLSTRSMRTSMEAFLNIASFRITMMDGGPCLCDPCHVFMVAENAGGVAHGFPVISLTLDRVLLHVTPARLEVIKSFLKTFGEAFNHSEPSPSPFPVVPLPTTCLRLLPRRLSAWPHVVSDRPPAPHVVSIPPEPDHHSLVSIPPPPSYNYLASLPSPLEAGSTVLSWCSKLPIRLWALSLDLPLQLPACDIGLPPFILEISTRDGTFVPNKEESGMIRSIPNVEEEEGAYRSVLQLEFPVDRRQPGNAKVPPSSGPSYYLADSSIVGSHWRVVIHWDKNMHFPKSSWLPLASALMQSLTLHSLQVPSDEVNLLFHASTPQVQVHVYPSLEQEELLRVGISKCHFGVKKLRLQGGLDVNAAGLIEAEVHHLATWTLLPTIKAGGRLNLKDRKIELRQGDKPGFVEIKQLKGLFVQGAVEYAHLAVSSIRLQTVKALLDVYKKPESQIVARYSIHNKTSFSLWFGQHATNESKMLPPLSGTPYSWRCLNVHASFGNAQLSLPLRFALHDESAAAPSTWSAPVSVDVLGTHKVLLLPNEADQLLRIRESSAFEENMAGQEREVVVWVVVERRSALDVEISLMGGIQIMNWLPMQLECKLSYVEKGRTIGDLVFSDGRQDLQLPACEEESYKVKHHTDLSTPRGSTPLSLLVECFQETVRMKVEIRLNGETWSEAFEFENEDLMRICEIETLQEMSDPLSSLQITISIPGTSGFPHWAILVIRRIPGLVPNDMEGSYYYTALSIEVWPIAFMYSPGLPASVRVTPNEVLSDSSRVLPPKNMDAAFSSQADDTVNERRRLLEAKLKKLSSRRQRSLDLSASQGSRTSYFSKLSGDETLVPLTLDPRGGYSVVVYGDKNVTAQHGLEVAFSSRRLLHSASLIKDLSISSSSMTSASLVESSVAASLSNVQVDSFHRPGNFGPSVIIQTSPGLILKNECPFAVSLMTLARSELPSPNSSSQLEGFHELSMHLVGPGTKEPFYYRAKGEESEDVNFEEVLGVVGASVMLGQGRELVIREVRVDDAWGEQCWSGIMEWRAGEYREEIVLLRCKSIGGDVVLPLHVGWGAGTITLRPRAAFENRLEEALVFSQGSFWIKLPAKGRHPLLLTRVDELDKSCDWLMPRASAGFNGPEKFLLSRLWCRSRHLRGKSGDADDKNGTEEEFSCRASIGVLQSEAIEEGGKLSIPMSLRPFDLRAKGRTLAQITVASNKLAASVLGSDGGEVLQLGTAVTCFEGCHYISICRDPNPSYLIRNCTKYNVHLKLEGEEGERRPRAFIQGGCKRMEWNGEVDKFIRSCEDYTLWKTNPKESSRGSERKSIFAEKETQKEEQKRLLLKLGFGGLESGWSDSIRLAEGHRALEIKFPFPKTKDGTETVEGGSTVWIGFQLRTAAGSFILHIEEVDGPSWVPAEEEALQQQLHLDFEIACLDGQVLDDQRPEVTEAGASPKSLPSLMSPNLLLSRLNGICIELSSLKVGRGPNENAPQAVIGERTLKCKIHDVRIENPNYSADFPVILCSLQSDKSHGNHLGQAAAPLICFEFTEAFLNLSYFAKGMPRSYVRDLSIAFSPSQVALDESLLSSITSFIATLNPGSRKSSILDPLHKPLSLQPSFPSSADSFDSSKALEVLLSQCLLSPRVYFQSVHLHPLSLTVNARLTVKGVFIGVEGSPLFFEAVKLSSCLCTPSAFLKDLLANYAADALLRSPAVLGSLQILGSPTMLLSRVVRGVTDLLVFSAQGTMDGPFAAIKGAGKGLLSLSRHVVGGALSSVAGFSASVARNLSPKKPSKKGKVQEGKGGMLGGLSKGLLTAVTVPLDVVWRTSEGIMYRAGLRGDYGQGRLDKGHWEGGTARLNIETWYRMSCELELPKGSFTGVVEGLYSYNSTEPLTTVKAVLAGDALHCLTGSYGSEKLLKVVPLGRVERWQKKHRLMVVSKQAHEKQDLLELYIAREYADGLRVGYDIVRFWMEDEEECRTLASYIARHAGGQRGLEEGAIH